MISTEQLRGLGAPRRRIEWLISNDQWQRIDRGLLYAGRGEPPWIALASAAVLAAGEDAVLWARTAAALHGLTHDEPQPITMLVPNRRTPTPRWFTEYTRATLRRRSQSVRRLPCTTVAETIVDCAASLQPHDLEAMIATAFQKRKVSQLALRKALAGRRRVAQRELLLAAAADAGAGAHSSLELAYLRNVESPHGLPVADRQFKVGSKNEWVDVHYREFGVVIELDGKAFHADATFRDHERDNRNAVATLITQRFGWAAVTAGACAVARQVAELLVSRGWTGAFTACRECEA